MKKLLVLIAFMFGVSTLAAAQHCDYSTMPLPVDLLPEKGRDSVRKADAIFDKFAVNQPLPRYDCTFVELYDIWWALAEWMEHGILPRMNGQRVYLPGLLIHCGDDVCGHELAVRGDVIVHAAPDLQRHDAMPLTGNVYLHSSALKRLR